MNLADFRLSLSLSIRLALLAGILAMAWSPAAAQQKRRIDIEHALSLESNNDIVANAQRVLGEVRIRHNEVLMWCDSAYAYTGTNKVDAFGNVHINQGDTIHLWADKIFYDGDISFARAMGNVRLVNKTTTLFSDTVDYDLTQNIGYYDDKGKIEDSTSVLTSQIGRYFVDQDVVWFFIDVEGNNENYTLTTDTAMYNTVTGMFTIQGPTFIKDSLNTIYAEDGWYNSQTGEGKLLKNPYVFNQEQQLKGDFIDYNRANAYGSAKGRVEIIDFENNVIVRGMNAWYDEQNEIAYMTDSAVFILVSEQDSLYLHADTLKTIPDTIKDEKIIKAYHGVRFYRSDLQGKCDSLVYFSADSTVQMFNSPVLWSETHQLMAAYIQIKSHTNAPDELQMNNDAFIISQHDSTMYDQIKGKNMVGYIVENKLNQIDVDGNGQTLYYATDKGEVIGLNRAESSKITIRFQEGKIHQIRFLTMPEGKMTPIPQLSDEERLLPGFEWKADLRPVSKDDIFRK